MIVVTGGLGFIGSQFVKHFIEESDEDVLVIDSLTYAASFVRVEGVNEGKIRVGFLHEEIQNPKLAANSFWNSVTSIVNFAAETHVDNSIEWAKPFIETNVNGVVNLLEIARTYDIEFIQISTDEVYGSIPFEEYADESYPLTTSSAYSASKASADLFVESYGRTHGVRYKILRATNNYGPYQHPEKFIPKIIQNLTNGRKIPVYGSGTQTRQWLHVNDFAKAIKLVMDKGENANVYNVGGNVSLTNLEVIEEILDCTIRYTDCYDRDEFIDYVEDRKGHDYRYAIDCSKIQKLGWVPDKVFYEEIEDIVGLGQSAV